MAFLPAGELTFIHQSAGKGNSAKLDFVLTAFCEVRIHLIFPALRTGLEELNRIL